MRAKTFKSLREIFGYSLDDLTKKMRCDLSYIVNMENNDLEVSFTVLKMLSNIYGISIKKIVELDSINGSFNLSPEQIKFMVLAYKSDDTCDFSACKTGNADDFLDYIKAPGNFSKYRYVDVASFIKIPYKLYTRDNGLIEGNITSLDFLELADYSDEEIIKGIETNEKHYKGMLSFNEYLYLCLSKYSDNLNLSYEIANRIKTIGQSCMEKVKYVSMIDYILSDNQYLKFPDFEINDDFLRSLNENINPNYTAEERIFYYYFKMCFLLREDYKYLFAFFISRNYTTACFRKSANRLSSINASNNHVSCFEFEAILNKLMQKEGALTKIEPFSGSSTHTYTEAVVDKRHYIFDSFTSHLDSAAICDFINVRMGNLYTGIVADSLEGNSYYYPHINKIYNDVCTEMHCDRKKFDPFELEECFLGIDNLKINDSLKSRLKRYFSYFNRYPLESGEFYLNFLKDRRFDFNDVIKMTGVCSTINDYGLGFVLSVCQDNDQYMYFYFGEDDTIKIFDEKKMSEMIEENKIIIATSLGISETIYRTIPGIDTELQEKMNHVAVETILPKLFNDIYEESLVIGDQDSNSIQKKKSDNF